MDVVVGKRCQEERQVTTITRCRNELIWWLFPLLPLVPIYILYIMSSRTGIALTPGPLVATHVGLRASARLQPIDR